MVATRQSRRKNSSADNDNDNGSDGEDQPIVPDASVTPTRKSPRTRNKSRSLSQESEMVDDEEIQEGSLVDPQPSPIKVEEKGEEELSTPKRARSPTRRTRSKSPTRSTTSTGRSRSKSPTRKKGSDSANTETEVSAAKKEPDTADNDDLEQTEDLPVIQDSEPDEDNQELGNNQGKPDSVHELQKSDAEEEEEMPKKDKDQKSKDSALPTVEDDDNAKSSATMVTSPLKQSPLPAVSKVATISAAKPKKKRKKKAPKNELTSFIPGYTAKLQLDSSSLKSQRPGLDALRKRALVTDKATAAFVKGTLANQKSTQGVLATGTKASSAIAASSGGGKIVKSSFKHGTKREAPNNAGDGWFRMVSTPMTEDVKRDLKVIRYRNYLDPKRFYKSADTTSKFVQVGTVVEGTSEFFSSRLTKKERRSNLTEELMADPTTADYTKRKFRNMQQEKGRKRQKMSKKRKNNGKKLHA